MVRGRRFFSNRDWMLLCIFASTYLYNELFYSLGPVQMPNFTCAKPNY